MFGPDYNDEYTDDEHNDQLKLFRDLSESEQQWVSRCERRVQQLLNSLTYEDASRPLFTFGEQLWFSIKRNRRPKA